MDEITSNTSVEEAIEKAIKHHCVMKAQWDEIKDKLDKALPRWAFLASLSTFIGMSLIFGGWHVSSLKTLSHELKALVKDLETQHNTDFLRLQSQYQRDVERFYDAAKSNNDLLIKVRTIQENVLVELEEINEKQNKYNYYDKR